MKTTSNLGLKKPEGTDLVDIDDLNDNADILDTTVKSLQDHAADAVKHITAAERAAWNAKASTAGATTAAAGLMSAGDKSKLDGVATGANNYTHPATHPPAIIAQDASNRFTTDAEKAAWNAKAGTAVATTSANGLMPAADKVLATNLGSLPTTTGTATAYLAAISAGSILTAGLRFSFKAHVASGANPTLNPNALGAKPIKKPNGNAAVLALNGVYTVVYDGTNFILQGEGGEYGTAGAAQVLSGYTVGTEQGVLNGAIPVYGAQVLPNIGAATNGTTLFLNGPKGSYETSTAIAIEDPDFNPANIPEDINIFGLQGGIPRRGVYTNAVSSGWDGSQLFVRIPGGVYQNNSGQGTPEIVLSAAQARADGNIVPSNIRAGVWVYGVLGTLMPGPSRRTVSTSGSTAAAGNTGSILSIGACPQGFSFIGTGNGLRIVGTSIVQIFDASGNYVNILSNASVNRTDVISSILIDPASDLVYFCVNGAIGQTAISGNNLNVNTPLYLNVKGGVTANTFTLQGTMLY